MYVIPLLVLLCLVFDSYQGSVNVTMIIALNVNDFPYLSLLMSMWSSFISVALYLPSSVPFSQLEDTISTTLLTDRVHLIVIKQQQPDEVFPLSKLVNTAIHYCQTTHYLISDSSVFFSCFFLFGFII